eukprot:5347812-Pyramimonas_sp.AAC.1
MASYFGQVVNTRDWVCKSCAPLMAGALRIPQGSRGSPRDFYNASGFLELFVSADNSCGLL